MVQGKVPDSIFKKRRGSAHPPLLRKAEQHHPATERQQDANQAKHFLSPPTKAMDLIRSYHEPGSKHPCNCQQSRSTLEFSHSTDVLSWNRVSALCSSLERNDNTDQPSDVCSSLLFCSLFFACHGLQLIDILSSSSRLQGHNSIRMEIWNSMELMAMFLQMQRLLWQTSEQRIKQTMLVCHA